MKKILCALVLLLVPACGTDNSSRVGLQFDGAGCLVAATGFDWSSETVSEAGVRTQNYRWECAEYSSPLTGRSVKEKQVTLTFVGADCLLFESELVLEGRCQQGKTPTF